MKQSIYKLAALQVFKATPHSSSKYACNAIMILKKSNRTHISMFREYFEPCTFQVPMVHQSTGWFGDNFNKQNQLARTLALLFMAEIEKDFEVKELNK